MTNDVRPNLIALDDDASGLRLALRRLAKAVVIVTAKHEGVRFAMAATAVSELSFDPPSMLVCVNKSASIHPVLEGGASFCVNILHASQEDLARHCSGALKGEARFSMGDWGNADNDVPFLRDAQASVVCDRAIAVVYGTHSIFIGKVRDVFVAKEVNPLIYADGKYGSVSLPGQ